MKILITNDSNHRWKMSTSSPKSTDIWSKSVISTSSDIQNHDFDDDFLDDDFDDDFLDDDFWWWFLDRSKSSSTKSWFWWWFFDDDFCMMIFWWSSKPSSKSSSKSWFWISDDVDITDLDQISMDFGDDVDIFEPGLLSKGLIWPK